MTPWTEHRIAALRTLCREATPGPWEVYPEYAAGMRVAAPNPDCPDDPYEIVVGPTNHHDWVENDAFIAVARTALPEALDEIERLRSALIQAKIIHATLVVKDTWPEAFITVEVDEEQGQELWMRWMTVTLPGHDENGARGPYTHRTWASIDKNASVTDIFVIVGSLMRLAVDSEARPKVDPSVIRLLTEAQNV